MKKSLLKPCLIICLSSFGSVNAGSNNGYTTAANVYSGSSSLGWYGGGVAYRLAEWRKKEDVAEEPDTTVSANPEDVATAVDGTAEQNSTAIQSDVTSPADDTTAVDNTAEQSSTADTSTPTQSDTTSKEKANTGTDAETQAPQVDGNTQ